MTDTDGTPPADSNEGHPRLRRALHIVGVLLLVAIVVPFVIYAVPQTVGADHSYVVLSGSMDPTMSPGDAVVVNDVRTGEIESGDIITFSSSDQARPTTHRVIEVVQEDDGVAFRTAGDNNEDPDQALVTPGQVEGRVPHVAGSPFVIPFIGYVITFAASQTGFVLLVAIPIGLLIITEIWSLSKGFREDAGGTDAGTTAVSASTESGDPADSQTAGSTANIEEPPVAHADSVRGVGTDTATLTGTLWDLKGAGSAEVYFEWGQEGGSLSNTTSTQTLSSTGRFSADISGLSPGTEYEFRAVAEPADRTTDIDAVASTPTADEESTDSAVTFTAPELELGLFVLAAFLAYSVWVAIQTVEIWAFTAVGAVGASFLLLLALYLSGRLGSGPTAETETDSEGKSEPDLDPATVFERVATARGRAEAVRAAAATDRSRPNGVDVLVTPEGTVLPAEGGEPRIQQEGTDDD
jgi:signal peptidase I